MILEPIIGDGEHYSLDMRSRLFDNIRQHSL